MPDPLMPPAPPTSPLTTPGSFPTIPQYGDLYSQMEQARQNATKANETRYQQLLQGYGDIAGGYSNRTKSFMDMIDQLGGTQRNRLEEQFTKKSASTEQELIKRGMYNTSAALSTQRGVDRDKARAQTELEDAILRQKAEFGANLTRDELESKKGLLGAIEGRNDIGPQYEQLMQLASILGQGSAGNPWGQQGGGTAGGPAGGTAGTSVPSAPAPTVPPPSYSFPSMSFPEGRPPSGLSHIGGAGDSGGGGGFGGGMVSSGGGGRGGSGSRFDSEFGSTAPAGAKKESSSSPVPKGASTSSKVESTTTGDPKNPSDGSYSGTGVYVPGFPYPVSISSLTPAELKTATPYRGGQASAQALQAAMSKGGSSKYAPNVAKQFDYNPF